MVIEEQKDTLESTESSIEKQEENIKMLLLLDLDLKNIPKILMISIN